MPGPKGEGDLQGFKKAAFRAGGPMEVIGPRMTGLPSAGLVQADLLDLARLGRPDIDRHAVVNGLFGVNGLVSPGHSLKAAFPLVPPDYLQQAADLSHTARRTREAKGRPYTEAVPTDFELPRERARLQPELDARREMYRRVVEGEIQLDLDHPDLVELREYGNEILDGTRRRKDGSQYGLRVRAEERNQGNQEMMEMSEMSFAELVDHVKEHGAIHFKRGTQDFLHPRDYAKATAGTAQWGEALFYHDASALVDGILASDIADNVDYAKGIVENLVVELYILDMIPNGSSQKLMKQSNPPSLTRMGLRIHDRMIEQADGDAEKIEKANAWLGIVMEAAEHEFTAYWKNPKGNHTVKGSTLITAGDTDIGAHDSSERETGMDTTSEYHNRAHDYQVTHINAALIGYAWDIAAYKRSIGDHEGADRWQDIGDEMATEMRQKEYDGRIYRDRDARRTGLLNSVASLNGYKTLAVGVPLPEHADTMEQELDKFIGPFGVAHLIPETVPPLPETNILEAFHPELRATVEDTRGPRQWGDREKNKNEWPIDIDALIDGFARYEKYDTAISIAENWLMATVEEFKSTQDNDNEIPGTVSEKRSVITGKNGEGVEYPQQTDFGWTVALTLKIMARLPELYARRTGARRHAEEARKRADREMVLAGTPVLADAATLVDFSA